MKSCFLFPEYQHLFFSVERMSEEEPQQKKLQCDENHLGKKMGNHLGNLALARKKIFSLHDYSRVTDRGSSWKFLWIRVYSPKGGPQNRTMEVSMPLMMFSIYIFLICIESEEFFFTSHDYFFMHKRPLPRSIFVWA